MNTSGTSTSPVSEQLLGTRQAWHQLAEHVLAPARYAVDNHIWLRPAPGGFATPPFGSPPVQLAIDGAELVVTRNGQHTRSTPRTLRQAAAAVGIDPGLPPGVYPPATPCQPDELLQIDVDSAATLAEWFQLGDRALSEFAPDSTPRLWPEHFDLGITVNRVNYGISPGDAAIPQPYAYVGPWERPSREQDAFFDRPFGAARLASEVPTVADLLAFFTEGRTRADELPPPAMTTPRRSPHAEGGDH
jgi:hypothetical protein